MIDVVLHRKRQLPVGSVHRRRRRKQKMTAAIVPASLQNVGKTDQVRIHVGMRVSKRIPHAGLRSEVDHDGKPMPRKQFRNRNAIRQVQSLELKALVVAENIEPRGLQLRIVIRIQVVDPYDAVTGLKQSLRHVESDEARGSR